MTDRINSFVVVLDRDLRDDDVNEIVNAIKMIKHVIDVKPHVADLDAIVAQSRVRVQVTQKLHALMTELNSIL
jgi:hypothetical protein